MNKICIVLLSTVVFSHANAGLNQDNDKQIWLTGGTKTPIENTGYTLGFHTEHYFGDDGNTLWLSLYDLSVSTKFNAHHGGGLVYRQLRIKSGLDWIDEERPMINYTYSKKWKPISFSNRLRMEFRFKEGSSAVYRLRERLMVGYPVKLESFSLKPYLSEEVFIDDVHEKINELRSTAGVDVKKDSFQYGIFFLWRYLEKPEEWISHYNLGLKLNYLF